MAAHIIGYGRSGLDQINPAGAKSVVCSGFLVLFIAFLWVRKLSGFMVSELVSGSSGSGSSPGRGHCLVFLDNTLNSNRSSLHPGV